MDVNGSSRVSNYIAKSLHISYVYYYKTYVLDVYNCNGISVAIGNYMFSVNL